MLRACKGASSEELAGVFLLQPAAWLFLAAEVRRGGGRCGICGARGHVRFSGRDTEKMDISVGRTWSRHC